jgi:hypothetical protein
MCHSFILKDCNPVTVTVTEVAMQQGFIARTFLSLLPFSVWLGGRRKKGRLRTVPGDIERRAAYQIRYAA